MLEANPFASNQLPTGDDNFGFTHVQFRFINSSTQISSNTIFAWNFGDGNSSQVQNPGSHSYANLGNYIIQLKASSQNCSDSTEIPVIIEAPNPDADFGDSAVGCEPLQVTFNRFSSS